MSPQVQQQQLIAQLSIVEDAQERLALVVDRVRKLPPMCEAERIESNRVQGCVSRVWLVGTVVNGRCRFRLDADSTLVKGLAALICDVYEGTSPEDTIAFEPTILDALHLTDQLSPTRRHGLAQVRRAIHRFASEAMAGPAEAS